MKNEKNEFLFDDFDERVDNAACKTLADLAEQSDHGLFNNVDRQEELGISAEQLAIQYEPLVRKFANSASYNTVCSNEDLCQEGRLAIILAYNTFNPSKGAALGTWVYHMVKDAIIEYQKKHLSILSGGTYLQNVLKKAGEDASVEEIMQYGVSRKTAMAAAYTKSSYSAADYDELATFIGDEDVFVEEESLEWRKYLTPEEVYIIEQYFGYNGEEKSMVELGQELNSSRKSISYKINKALVKLRKIPGIEKYASWR